MASSDGAAHNEPAAKPGCILGTLFGAVIGGSCAGLLFVTGFKLTWDLKSTDFLGAVLSALGVMLAGISVLLALLVLALTVGAIYGWQEFKRRASDTAAQRAADIAGPAAVEVAVPAAIKQVDEYLDKNLDPEIRQKIISIVGQVVTPEFIKSMISDEKDFESQSTDDRTAQDGSVLNDAVEAAASEEINRQKEALDAFDATVEASEMRGDDSQPQGDDV